MFWEPRFTISGFACKPYSFLSVVLAEAPRFKCPDPTTTAIRVEQVAVRGQSAMGALCTQSVLEALLTFSCNPQGPSSLIS